MASMITVALIRIAASPAPTGPTGFNTAREHEERPKLNRPKAVLRHMRADADFGFSKPLILDRPLRCGSPNLQRQALFHPKCRLAAFSAPPFSQRSEFWLQVK
ncbi:hypothetical protein [Rhizobium sp. 11515TR]|uniref:hypothetical protein n=1 Tax=unclassified Rhizobium TaxID=2613769 RepID=UPI001FCEECB5|nr:hypothetical protein [Rhizobium sp. 11515TR]